MKKKWFKKGKAVLLAMALLLFQGMPAMVQAEENTTPPSEYWTDVDGLKKFSLEKADDVEGKVIFGKNYSGEVKQWKIAGTDSKIAGDNIILLDTSLQGEMVFSENINNRSYCEDWNCTYPEGKTITEVYPNHYGSSDLRTALNTYMNANNYFSVSEKERMNPTTIYTDDIKNNTVYSVTDKLYIPYGEEQYRKYVTVGTNTSDNLNGGVKIDVSKCGETWLRSPDRWDERSKNAALAVSSYAGDIKVMNPSHSVRGIEMVVPVCNLNLSSVIFASAAYAASSKKSGYMENSDMIENTYTLRYKSEGKESAVISADGAKVTIENANGKYLMVQNSAGVYVLPIDSNDKTVKASDIVMGSALDSFNNCKVWVESTDADRITTAKLAIQDTVINSVEVTGIDAPTAGKALDTKADCATTGVESTTPGVTWKQGEDSVTGNAGYNTTYTASVTLAAAKNYEFAPKVTATVNGKSATSVTKNEDGTVTVTYEFPVTEKVKQSSDSTPSTSVYKITLGAGGEHKLGTNGTLMLTCDGALDKLTGIYVDDKLVDASNYTLESGSTILSFKAAYLNALSVGTHKVKFQYTDGNAETTFVIKDASAGNTTSSKKSASAKTGDSTPITWLYIIAAISVTGAYYLFRMKAGHK